MRKHKSTYTNVMGMLTRKARELYDARIDAATVEYAELLMNVDGVDFNDIDKRISEAKSGGFPPLPRWREGKTVDDVPDARGTFTW